MSRKIEEIQAGIIADVAAQPDLSYVDKNGDTQNITTNTSKRAIWRLWTFIVASAIVILEILMDIFKAENEAKIAAAIPETKAWLSKEVSKFQYSATNPQVIQLIDLIPQYPVINPDLQIVTRRSVTTTNNNQVLIKVAKSEPPVALVTAEINALQDFVNTIGVPGISYKVSSKAPDKLFVQATVFYQGQYSAVISANVIAAIDNFLTNLSSVDNFNGTVKMSDLETTIRGVTGVNDVVLVNVRARQDSTPLTAADYLIQAQTLNSRLWPTVAGYIVQETTAGNTFADTLTFTPQ